MIGGDIFKRCTVTSLIIRCHNPQMPCNTVSFYDTLPVSIMTKITSRYGKVTNLSQGGWIWQLVGNDLTMALYIIQNTVYFHLYTITVYGNGEWIAPFCIAILNYWYCYIHNWYVDKLGPTLISGTRLNIHFMGRYDCDNFGVSQKVYAIEKGLSYAKYKHSWTSCYNAREFFVQFCFFVCRCLTTPPSDYRNDIREKSIMVYTGCTFIR